VRILGRKVEWWHLVLGATGLALLFWEDDVAGVVEDVGNVIGDLTKRGQRLTVSPRLNAQGQVPTAPEDLLAEAQVTLGRPIRMDAYALARMVRAEGGSGPVPEKQARAWVALNDAAKHGWSILKAVAGPDLLFGQQRGWRYASGRDYKDGSTSDPYENDLYVAEAVLAGQLTDNTGGALKFVDIDSFGVQPGTGTYEETVASWARDGLQPFEVDGTSSTFRVFRRVA
jgi:hypothetical protein